MVLEGSPRKPSPKSCPVVIAELHRTVLSGQLRWASSSLVKRQRGVDVFAKSQPRLAYSASSSCSLPVIGQKEAEAVDHAVAEGGQEHSTAESLFDQRRQIAGVIDVRVGEDDVVDAGRGERVAAPVA